jgi:hypothetical protein
VPPPGQPPLLRAVRQSLSIYARRARALARLSGDVVAISSRRAALDDDAVIAVQLLAVRHHRVEGPAMEAMRLRLDDAHRLRRGVRRD